MTVTTNYPRTLTKAVLKKAAEILQERGLHKGHYIDHNTGRVCMLGAIGIALDGDSYSGMFCENLDVLAEAVGIEHIPTWNDMKSRRRGQVIKKLLEMAEKAPSE